MLHYISKGTLQLGLSVLNRWPWNRKITLECPNGPIVITRVLKIRRGRHMSHGSLQGNPPPFAGLGGKGATNQWMQVTSCSWEHSLVRSQEEISDCSLNSELSATWMNLAVGSPYQTLNKRFPVKLTPWFQAGGNPEQRKQASLLDFWFTELWDNKLVLCYFATTGN